ncbi:hypothetical protein K438DRAFT_1849679, partial [Mycena galopus ATCC 62051]
PRCFLVDLIWPLGLATLYLGGQVSCKPQEPGNQFQSCNLGTATLRKFHASSDPPSSGQRHYNTSSGSSIYCFGAPPSARPTLGGFWMCCSCLCVPPPAVVLTCVSRTSTSCRDAWTWGSGVVEGTVDAWAGYG